MSGPRARQVLGIYDTLKSRIEWFAAHTGERIAVPKPGESLQAFAQRAQQVRQQEASKLKEMVGKTEPVGSGPPEPPWWFGVMETISNAIQGFNSKSTIGPTVVEAEEETLPQEQEMDPQLQPAPEDTCRNMDVTLDAAGFPHDGENCAA